MTGDAGNLQIARHQFNICSNFETQVEPTQSLINRTANKKCRVRWGPAFFKRPWHKVCGAPVSDGPRWVDLTDVAQVAVTTICTTSFKCCSHRRQNTSSFIGEAHHSFRLSSLFESRLKFNFCIAWQDCSNPSFRLSFVYQPRTSMRETAS